AGLAVCLGASGDHEAARREAERALAASPNLPSAHQSLAMTLIFGGHPQEGLVAIDRCIRLDPQDPAMWLLQNWSIAGHYFSGDYEAATEAAKRANRSFAEYPTPYRWLAAALSQLGRLE